MLFTRVQTFSYAKDIREKYKSKKKHMKKSSLRTEIKKASSSTVKTAIFIVTTEQKHVFVYFLFIVNMTL